MRGTLPIRRKIESAEQLQSVVRTMKVLAAANIRDCDRAVEALAEYGSAMELAFQAVVRRGPRLLDEGERRAHGRLGAVVFGSDQGMCGQLNDAVVEYAVKRLAARSADAPPRVHVVGDRVAARLERERRFPPEKVQSMPQSLVTIAAGVRETLLSLESWREEGAVTEIVLFYAKRSFGASFRPHHARLLPIDRDWIEELKSREWPSRGDPLVALGLRRMFRLLVRQHLYISLYRAFAESMASENASRLASMGGAERNIEERLDELEREYRGRRQTVITGELLDIVSGFEALEQER